MGVQTSDELIHQLARLQHGVLSLDQARAVGLSKDDVRTRVRRGQYRRLWRGVIWVDAELADEPPWESRAAGALLFCGPRAVLGLSSATRALAISGADQSDRCIDILLPTGSERHQVPGIALHFWDVPPHRRVTTGALRCSDPVQTLGDLVPRLSRNSAVSVLDSARTRASYNPRTLRWRRTSPPDVPDARRRGPGGGWPTDGHSLHSRPGCGSIVSMAASLRTSSSSRSTTVTGGSSATATWPG
jgi:hypothetical protein